MIAFYDRIPKEYERAAIEEYFKFFNWLYGKNHNIFSRSNNFKYTSDTNKLRSRELGNVSFRKALEVIENKDENIQFALCSVDNSHFVASARVVKRDDMLHVSDIIYFEYPNLEEQIIIVDNIMRGLSDAAFELNLPIISYEIPKYDIIALRFLLQNGWHLLDEPSSETSKHPTFVIEKNVLTEERNEPTRRR